MIPRQGKGQRETGKGKVSLFKQAFLIFSLLPFTLNPVWAGDPGSTTGELLSIPVGTRAIGMGEAYTALADDSSALYWNPAGMSFATQKEASFMHSSLIESVHLEQLSYISPGDSYAFGTSFNYLGYGGINGYDTTGNPTGNVNAYSYVLNGGVSRLVTDALSLGVSGGIVHETLDTDSANTFAANAGAIYQLPYHPWSGDYNVGMSALNLGPGLKYVSDRAPLPEQLKLGVAAMGIKQLPLNLTADIGIPNDNVPYLSFGSEYWFREMIALRLGYAGSNDEGKGLRLGFGVKYSGLLFDYAYGNYGDFGATQRISLAMRFGEKVRQLNNDERAILKEAKASERNGAYVPAIIAYNELLDKDPSNDHVLHMMINAHDQMTKNEVQEEVAQKAVPIPSPEDAAMAEMVPDASPAMAKNTSPATTTDMGTDPMGYNKLPDLNTLDVAVGDPFKGSINPVASATSGSGALPDVNPPANANSPALSPADIYGN